MPQSAALASEVVVADACGDVAVKGIAYLASKNVKITTKKWSVVRAALTKCSADPVAEQLVQAGDKVC